LDLEIGLADLDSHSIASHAIAIESALGRLNARPASTIALPGTSKRYIYIVNHVVSIFDRF
jgi:hypothetical protein